MGLQPLPTVLGVGCGGSAEQYGQPSWMVAENHAAALLRIYSRNIS